MSYLTTTEIELYALSRLRSRSLAEHLLICEACRASFSKKDEAVRLIRSELEAEVTVASTRAARVPNNIAFKGIFPFIRSKLLGERFRKKQEVKPEGWIEVRPSHSILTKDMFVTHVERRSMQPKIPDGSLCAFRSNVSVPYSGKVLLLKRYGEPGGNRYTVSQYRISKSDPHKEGDREWLHERFTLERLNPEFLPWDVASHEKVNVIGEFVFVVQSNSAGELGLVS